MSKKTFKVALVGCGTIAPNHLAALEQLPYVKVTALCDKRPENAEAMKTRFACDARIYNDFDTMLENEELDSVHIATPHFLHAPMAIKALEKGLNVFLEKPMCISREEIDALLDAEARSTGRIAVSFQNRFNDTTEVMKRIIEEDGGAESAYGTVIWERDEKYYLESDWRGSYATEGGGVLINQAIHTLDLLCQILGKPRYLFATTSNHHLKGKIEVEDSSEGMIEFESGVTGNFYATTSFRHTSETNVFIKTKNHSIEIIDSEIYVDKVRQTPESCGNPQIGKDCYGRGHYTLIRKFYEALISGEEMPVTLESAQWAVRILLAAYKSNDQRTEI